MLIKSFWENINMNKKGDISSIIVMIILVVMSGIIVIAFSKGFLEVTERLKESGEFSDTSKEAIEMVEERTIPLLDFFVFFLLIAMSIGLIISSIYLRLHPALIVVLIFGIFLAVFLAGQFANVFAEVTDHDELADTASQFKLTNLILGSNFPLIILVIGVIMVIILYSKRHSGAEV